MQPPTYIFSVNTHPLPYFEESPTPARDSRRLASSTGASSSGGLRRSPAAIPAVTPCGSSATTRAHTRPAWSGETPLYAASRVLKKEVLSAETGSVTFKLVGTKNIQALAALLDGGLAVEALFTSELGKTDAGTKVKDKVFEIERTVLLRRLV